MTGNHLADQAQAAENKRGCCPECGRMLDEVRTCPDDGKYCAKNLCEPSQCQKQKDQLYCPACGVYLSVE